MIPKQWTCREINDHEGICQIGLSLGKIALKKWCGWILEPSNLYDFGGNECNYKDVWSRDCFGENYGNI